MQNKGLIKVFTIIFGLVCIYQLSFTFVTNDIEGDAEVFAEQRISETEENYAKKREQLEDQYLDSIGEQEVFLGVTYNVAKQRELNKGLDLKGGINVILQVSVEDILRGLSNDSKNPAFNQALAKANEQQANSQENYVDLFFQAFEEIPGAKLASPDIFANKTLSDDIRFDMTNEEVKPIIRQKIDESILSAFEILRQRIDKFGVTQPNIQRLGSSGRIMVELPGAKDIDRVRALLQSTAQLEFWHVYSAGELQQFLLQANNVLKDIVGQKEEKTKTTDSISTDENDLEELLTEVDDTLEVEKNPLLDLIVQPGFQQGGIIATFAIEDTAKVNNYLSVPQVRSLLPANMKYLHFAWGKTSDESKVVDLYALKGNRDSEPPLAGNVIVDATQTYDQMGRVAVSMQMNGKGAKIWEEMTRKAYEEGSQIAIVLDNVVYSAPGVSTGAIAGGRSEITGDFTIEEGQDLANVLNAGRLPASADIIQSAIVGPSLGQAAIDAGTTSFLLALVLVLIFMVFYYGKAGFFADITLAVNLLFIFGILAGLGAVLTLPGIAGIVLTIGMAVDANVIIFERIREELRKGKSQRDAIKEGFSGALPSIIDANITTALVGVILFVLGTGPIKGFATTLLIGLATSVFTAVFVTRLFTDSYSHNGKSLVFSTPFTKNWFANVHVAFMKKRKYFYIGSGIFMVVGIGSLFTQGLDQGVDFVGGRSYIVRFDHDVVATEVEEDLTAVFGSIDAKTYGTENQLKITTKYKIEDESNSVENEIQQKLYTALGEYLPGDLSYEEFGISGTATPGKLGLLQKIKVSPTIADDIKQASIWAVLGSLIVVFLYILMRFKKWQYSMGAVAAVFHDALFVIAVFSLTYKFMPFSMEIDQAFIAAILTVIGYSLNDTVIIYDRLREYFREGHSSWNMEQTVDHALSSTLSRTLNTALTTLLVLFAIFIFGGESIRGFMFALIIGVCVGVYSTLFIASGLTYDTMKHFEEAERKKVEAEKKKLGEKK
ncbi:MAG TPA: protein translocase subunit SecDF [Flavobacteriaceae bacterium]|nr:protein translocase subunit SecDF [Flavobacteriaceae bacterium]